MVYNSLLRHGVLLAVLLPIPLITACGDEEEDTGPTIPTYVEDAAALDLAAVRGLPHTWAETFETREGAYVQFATDTAQAQRLVHREQLVGENRRFWDTSQPPVSDLRPDAAIARALQHPDYGETMRGFSDVTFVLDLMRLDGAWLVDWEGRNRHLPDQRDGLHFGLASRDYANTILGQLDAIASAWQGDGRTLRIVLGAEMERYWLLNPEDWTNFIQLVRDARELLAEDHPDVEFSVGINWSTFMQRIVPMFEVEDPMEEEDLPEDFENFDDAGNPAFLLVERAWSAVIEPLYFDRMPDPEDAERMRLVPAVDFLAFSSVPSADGIRDVNELPALHWRGLRTLMREHEDRVLPVDWIAVGWPADAPTQQATFLNRFVSEAGGVDTRVAAWVSYVRLNTNECRRIRGENIGGSNALCTRGLVDIGGRPIRGIHEVYFR